MIENQITTIHPVLQALLATLFTWGLTALGAAGVFLAREIKQRTLDTMLGFASGVMIAASFWSLLAPSIEMAASQGIPSYLPAVLLIRPILPYALSFAAGAMIYVVVEELIPESQNGEHSDFATMGVMVGFAIMMALDVALG
jgi:zinc transporter, ZIP family